MERKANKSIFASSRELLPINCLPCSCRSVDDTTPGDITRFGINRWEILCPAKHFLILLLVDLLVSPVGMRDIEMLSYMATIDAKTYVHSSKLRPCEGGERRVGDGTTKKTGSYKQTSWFGCGESGC